MFLIIIANTKLYNPVSRPAKSNGKRTKQKHVVAINLWHKNYYTYNLTFHYNKYVPATSLEQTALDAINTLWFNRVENKVSGSLFNLHVVHERYVGDWTVSTK